VGFEFHPGLLKRDEEFRYAVAGLGHEGDPEAAPWPNSLYISGLGIGLGRYVLAKVAEKVPGWVARILLPEIRAIVKEEVASEVKRLDEKMDLLRNELLSEIKRVDERLGGEIKRVDERLGAEIKRVDEKLSAEIKRVDERLGAEIKRVEAELRGMDEKLTAKIDGLERALPLASRLAVLEAEVKELREKLSGRGP